MELGVTTFAETIPPADGAPIDHGTRLRQVVEEAQLADEVGLDVYGVGEHHRPDFASSAPAIVLTAIAAVTQNILLTPAVSVLSSDDPVRVYQQYATLDLLSGGRAELMVGRGSFTESFPLFGYSLADYDELFAEKLELLLAIRDNEHVTWEGRLRPPLTGQGVYPRALQDPLPVWLAVGGTLESAIRAGTLGIPMTLAIIGGRPGRFATFSDLHRQALAAAGHDPDSVPRAVHAHGYIGANTEAAADEYFPPYAAAMTRIGKDRGWPPMTRDDFDAMRTRHGSLVIGRPDEVAAKIIRWRDMLDVERFMLHISVGTLDQDATMRAIRLLGTEVAPIVRAATSET